ncbi:MAG: hydrogenase maturation protease [Actinomycetota bacterium]|nr:hydrogenase maturation protease [Actinomycetota bacterium]
MSVLVACFGNVLRGDDGFGYAVAQRLLSENLPANVRVIEVGIGGIHLVQELMAGVEALIIVDAVDLGRPPGTVITQIPDVADVSALPINERRDQLADMHLATPERALMMAKGLGVLPSATFVVGVQTVDTERAEQRLSNATATAVSVAVEEVRRLAQALLG